MFVKIKESASADAIRKAAGDTLKDYKKKQQAFAQEKANSYLEAAGRKVTQANETLYEAGLIKGKLIR